MKKSDEVQLFPDHLNNIFLAGLEDVCLKLDNDNKTLLRLNQARDQKLGYYCEELLKVYFEAHPKISIEKSNWQINREGVTEGELDFILRIDGELVGLETSFKCYAQFGDGMKNWKGPRGKDSLFNKVDKVKTKQLPLFSSEEVEAEFGNFPTYFYLKGHLFSNNDLEHPDYLKKPSFGTIHRDELLKSIGEKSEYYLFPKRDWVSGIYYSPSERKITGKDLKTNLKNQYRSYILGIRDKKEIENYLILEN